ncbi:MAG: Rho termination factor N-terminal domain-containing protein [Clostridia bacterium]|nr:Rho termination factor N-terminal domain-containing protein [Clostridia bacterium]
MRRNELEKTSFAQLKVYARAIGVKSPTIFKKSELIDMIIKVENGEILPIFSNRGRKPYLSELTAHKSNNEYEYKVKKLIIELNEVMNKFNEAIIKTIEKYFVKD